MTTPMIYSLFQAATEAKANSDEQGPPLRYKQLIEAGQEDDEELADEVMIESSDYLTE